jgi:hypothetical protein
MSAAVFALRIEMALHYASAGKFFAAGIFQISCGISDAFSKL